MDTNTGTTTSVGRTHLDGIEGLAFAADGTLYAWHNGEGQGGAGLVTLDSKTGGAADTYPATGETAEIRGLAFDRDGTLHGAHQALHRVDLTDGTTTEIGAGGYFDLGGIAFSKPE